MTLILSIPNGHNQLHQINIVMTMHCHIHRNPFTLTVILNTVAIFLQLTSVSNLNYIISIRSPNVNIKILLKRFQEYDSVFQRTDQAYFCF